MLFKKYSEAQKKPTKPLPIPAIYQAHIDKHKGVLQCKFELVPKHKVIHTIDTADHPPCRGARVRPLMKNSPKETMGYKSWMESDEMGIMVKMKRQKMVTI